ncbi:hypothetical protein PJJ29_29170, partial [Mycobacterium kansasii]
PPPAHTSPAPAAQPIAKPSFPTSPSSDRQNLDVSPLPKLAKRAAAINQRIGTAEHENDHQTQTDIK